MSNYDDGEGFAAGDEFDLIDWRKLAKLRALIGEVADEGERRAIVVELLTLVHGDALDLR